MTDAITVLIADDDEDDRLLARDALDKNTLPKNLRFVSGGEELLRYLRCEEGDTSRPRPGIILLDLNMPGMDGRETLAAIKADPRLRNIPVIVLTTSGFERDVQAAYDLGASSYVLKPSTFAGLVDTLDVLIRYWLQAVQLPMRNPK